MLRSCFPVQRDCMWILGLKRLTNNDRLFVITELKEFVEDETVKKKVSFTFLRNKVDSLIHAIIGITFGTRNDVTVNYEWVF